ncbi:MAG TPA: metalloregulator ArsR/SmtB family transcription factor [Croceibacterium sp.]|jgi:DNA-binding transcriptional ArsR family regulator
MTTLTADLGRFEARAGEVAAMLKALASRPRLMLLCKLVEHGEMCVGDLADGVGLSQSALSQHLARMREEKLVSFRREGHSLFYSVADPRCEALLATLHHLYCSED